MKALAWIVIIILFAPLVYLGPGIISGMSDFNTVTTVAVCTTLWLIYILPAVALAAMVLQQKKESGDATKN